MNNLYRLAIKLPHALMAILYPIDPLDCQYKDLAAIQHHKFLLMRVGTIRWVA